MILPSERFSVHVGYPKTATTFLQRNVFPYLDGAEYLGERESTEILRSVFDADEKSYRSEETVQVLSTLVPESGGRCLLSSEGCIGRGERYSVRVAQ